MDFAVSADYRVKWKQGQKRDKYLVLTKELKKKPKNLWNMSNSGLNCNRWVQYIHQKTGKGTGSIGKKNTRGDHPNDSAIEVGQNTKKCPGD